MKIIGLFFLIVAIALTTCNTTDPPVDKAELLLKLEDVSCTEAWITLTTNNVQLPAEINLIRIETYKFQTVLQSGKHTSNEISVTTLDTTSHNFNWQAFTFGEPVSYTHLTLPTNREV